MVDRLDSALPCWKHVHTSICVSMAHTHYTDGLNCRPIGTHEVKWSVLRVRYTIKMLNYRFTLASRCHRSADRSRWPQQQNSQRLPRRRKQEDERSERRSTRIDCGGHLEFTSLHVLVRRQSHYKLIMAPTVLHAGSISWPAWPPLYWLSHIRWIVRAPPEITGSVCFAF